MTPRCTMCRFCQKIDIGVIEKSYASVLVMNGQSLQSKIADCETSLISSLSVWCNKCEKISLACGPYFTVPGLLAMYDQWQTLQN